MAEFKGKRGRKPAWTREVKPHARKVRTMPPKNPMGKSRSAYPVTDPYITLVDPMTGWTYYVLKTYQVDGHKPYGRAFCMVEGFAREAGDVYVDTLRGCELRAYDEAVFESADAAAEALFGKGAFA